MARALNRRPWEEVDRMRFVLACAALVAVSGFGCQDSFGADPMRSTTPPVMDTDAGHITDPGPEGGTPPPAVDAGSDAGTIPAADAGTDAGTTASADAGSAGTAPTAGSIGAPCMADTDCGSGAGSMGGGSGD